MVFQEYLLIMKMVILSDFPNISNSLLISYNESSFTFLNFFAAILFCLPNHCLFLLTTASSSSFASFFTFFNDGI